MKRLIIASLFFTVFFLSISATAIETFRHDSSSPRKYRPYLPTMLLHPSPSDDHTMSLSYMHPNLNHIDERVMTTWSGAYSFDFSLPISRHVNIEFSVPFASGRSLLYHFSYDGSFVEINGSEFALGNLYVGVQMQSTAMAEQNMSFALGARFGTADNEKANALAIAGVADFLNYQRYYAKAWSLYFNFSQGSNPLNRLVFGYEMGLDLIFKDRPVFYMIDTQTSTRTEVGSSIDSDSWVHYGFHISGRDGPFLLRTELAGVFLLSEPHLSITERFVKELAFGLFLEGETFRPGVYYVLPLDDDVNDVLNDVVGFKLAMVFP
jgi:hypothetical protein